MPDCPERNCNGQGMLQGKEERIWHYKCSRCSRLFGEFPQATRKPKSKNSKPNPSKPVEKDDEPAF